MRWSLIVLCALMTVAGCQTASRQTIQVAYGDQLEALTPGMTLDEFKKVLPKAREFQRMFVANEVISVYRLEHLYKQESNLPAEEQSLYFRFVDRKLDRWGYSTTWGE